MKIMILSDSHTINKQSLLSIMKSCLVDYYIHCGDIYMTYDGLPLSNFYLVRGNNDFNDMPYDCTITIDNLQFLITHGHRYYIDYDIDTLLHHAKEVQADIVCFGHTHRPYCKEIEGILFINPGSLCYPRGYSEPTYAILDTATKEVTFYKARDGQRCDPFTTTPKPPFSFKKLFKK